MAPESFYDGMWDAKSDMWSAGVVLWGECMLFLF